MEKFESKKIKIELNYYEVQLILKAVGLEQGKRMDSGNHKSADQCQWLIDKIYKAMGVKL